MKNKTILSIMEKFDLRGGVYVNNKFAGTRGVLETLNEFGVDVVVTAFNRDCTALTFNQRVDIARLIPDGAGFEFTGHAFQYFTGEQVDEK